VSESLGRSTRAMAFGTIASRGTGFVRTAVIASVIGAKSVADAFNLANTAPNIVYELLLGGILGSVVVPLLVRAAKQDGGDGKGYAQRLLSLVVVSLTLTSVLLVLAAPAIIALYGNNLRPADQELAVLFARFLLPQVLFYGAGAVMGAYLNARGRFGPPMWAPVLNNVVVIITGVVFHLMPGPDRLTAATITDAQILVLGIGVTLGIVAQTAVLVPSLRATGFRFAPRFDLRGSGLGQAARLAKWVLAYVLASQLAYVVVTNLANAAGRLEPGRGYSAYTYAYVLWQLPHAVVAVSIITALLPRMSRAAADERVGDLRRTLERGIGLTTSVLVPATVAFVVLGRDIAAVVYARGQISTSEARFIGVLLAVFALGLVPYSTYQLMLRVFYALQDTRTAFVVNLGVNVTMVAVDLTLFAVLPDDLKVIGLAAGHATSFAAGLVLCTFVLGRRIGGIDVRRLLRTALRCLLAAAVAAVPAVLLARLCTALLGAGPGGGLAAVAAGGAALGLVYLALARRLGVREVDEVAGPVLTRVGLRR